MDGYVKTDRWTRGEEPINRWRQRDQKMDREMERQKHTYICTDRQTEIGGSNRHPQLFEKENKSAKFQY